MKKFPSGRKNNLVEIKVTLESARLKVEISTFYIQAARLYLCPHFLIHQVRIVTPPEDFHKIKKENICKLLSPLLGPFYHPFAYSSDICQTLCEMETQ